MIWVYVDKGLDRRLSFTIRDLYSILNHSGWSAIMLTDDSFRVTKIVMPDFFHKIYSGYKISTINYKIKTES